jgi:hypothetical protein
MYNDKETGELRPGSKGISLTPEQFDKLLGALDGVKAALSAARPAADGGEAKEEEEEEAGSAGEKEEAKAAPPAKKAKSAAAAVKDE